MYDAGKMAALAVATFPCAIRIFVYPTGKLMRWLIGIMLFESLFCTSSMDAKKDETFYRWLNSLPEFRDQSYLSMQTLREGSRADRYYACRAIEEQLLTILAQLESKLQTKNKLKTNVHDQLKNEMKSLDENLQAGLDAQGWRGSRAALKKCYASLRHVEDRISLCVALLTLNDRSFDYHAWLQLWTKRYPTP
jgi:hypothetical protein